MVKQKTWRLIYPNGEESISNYNPIKEERKATIKEVEHKHQISLQCARDAMKANCIDVLRKNKTLSHKLKQNLIKKMIEEF